MTEPRLAPSGALLLACVLACPMALAQTATPSSTAASAAERAQKETDRTMYWIRVLATKPAPVKAVAAAAPTPAAPAPKAVVAAATPPARPSTDARDKVKVAAAATPATATTTSKAANLTPASLTVAQGLSQPSITDGPDGSTLGYNRGDSGATASTAAPPQPDPTPAAAAEPDPGLIQIKSVQPDFPGTVVKRVHKGSVEVRFEVDPSGTVVDAVVVESSNHRLNDAALEAIKQWRFKPTPMAHTAAVNLVFDIDKE